MDTHIARLDAIIPTLATREDLTRLEARVESLIPTLATREDLTRLEARVESLIPTLANREDLANLKSVLHSDMNKLTWLIVTLLAGLIPALLAATVYVVK